MEGYAGFLGWRKKKTIKHLTALTKEGIIETVKDEIMPFYHTVDWQKTSRWYGKNKYGIEEK